VSIHGVFVTYSVLKYGETASVSVTYSVKFTTEQSMPAQVGEKGYSCIFLTSAPDGGGWSTTFPHPFTRRKETRYPLFVFQEAGWASGPFWTGALSLASTGIHPRTVQPGYTIPVYQQKNECRELYEG